MEIQEIKIHLKKRLKKAESKLAQGIIPGELDSIEADILRGSIAELKFIMLLIEKLS